MPIGLCSIDLDPIALDSLGWGTIGIGPLGWDIIGIGWGYYNNGLKAWKFLNYNNARSNYNNGV